MIRRGKGGQEPLYETSRSCPRDLLGVAWACGGTGSPAHWDPPSAPCQGMAQAQAACSHKWHKLGVILGASQPITLITVKPALTQIKRHRGGGTEGMGNGSLTHGKKTPVTMWPMNRSTNLQRELLPRPRAGYERRSREGRTPMLDAPCADDDCERKYAIKRLRTPGRYRAGGPFRASGRAASQSPVRYPGSLAKAPGSALRATWRCTVEWLQFCRPDWGRWGGWRTGRPVRRRRSTACWRKVDS
jgi:hypothetical protein